MFKKIIFSLTLILPLISAAQVNMWGTGMYGGMQGCSTNVRAGTGATSMDDTTKEIMTEIQEAQQQLKTKKSEKKKVDRSVQKTRANIEKTISTDYSEFIFEHIENSRRCEEYRGLAAPEGFTAQGDEGEETIANANMIPVHGFTASEWSQHCDRGKSGSVSGSVCSSPKFQEQGGRNDTAGCRKSLSEYRKQHSQAEKLQREIEGLENQIANLKEDLKDAKQEAREEAREGGSFAQTEGDVCIECIQNGSGGASQRNQTDWANVIANVGTGLFASYVGYKQNQMVAEYNSNAGWPTQSYPALGYGYPYLVAGLYGAMGGGTGQGAFGCGSGMYGTGNMNGPMGMTGAFGMGGLYGSMGGAFGYPAGMMGNTMGGGMYMGGMMGSYAGSMMGAYTGSMMGGMMGYDSSSLALQQQMMQMQMQQYQTALQYQQQYQQQMMQKYQTVSSLQQEMYSLMARIQQIQYGGTGYLGGTLGTGTSYYSTGTSSIVPIPLTGTSTTTTIIPAGR